MRATGRQGDGPHPCKARNPADNSLAHPGGNPMMVNAKLLRFGPLAVLAGACRWAASNHNPPAYERPVRTYKKQPAQAAVANTQLAIEYMKLNQLANARDCIERALSEDASNADVQATAALVYERLNDPGKAERSYESAMRVARNDPRIANSLAGFLCRTGKTAAGEKMFNEVVRNPLYTTPEVALVNAGVCGRSAGTLLDADRHFITR